MKPLASVTELKNLRDQSKNNLAKREKLIQVKVHLGTCGISSGASKILEAFQREIKSQKLEDKVIISKAACIGQCGREPVATVICPGSDKVIYCDLTEDKVSQIVKKHFIGGELLKDWTLDLESPLFKLQEIRIMHNQDLDPMNIDEYIARDGYQALGKVLSMKPEDIIAEVAKSGLRGRGGAGFPSATKWGMVRNAVGDEKYVVCNGDEGDPGAYMNRSALEGNPHALIEGMAIGAYAIGNVRQGYAYVRAEYPLAIETLNHAIKKAREYGLLGKNILGTDFEFDLDIFPGAGAFVCGEETALLISIEGKRGNPRQRPPFPANKGLFDKPTTLNNVETWSNVPRIIWDGADWFSNVGSERSKGTKTLCLVGKVNNSGLIEVPLGTTLADIIFSIGGGIPDGKKFKGVQLGGPSGGVIPAQHLNTPVDYDAVTALGAIMGSGGVVVMDDDTCMVELAKYFLQFSKDESCGKCTPCRAGIPQMLQILTKITSGKGTMQDIDTLTNLAETIASASICGLGQTAPNPVLTTLRYFRKEYEAHILDKKCPASVCQALFSAPCQHTCPVGINVPEYLAYIADNDFKRALDTIREKNPFAAVCGYICHHPCEAKCRRRDIDESIAIRTLKRTAADWCAENAVKLPKPKAFPKTQNEKIAVVGAGPAGLACAYFLAQMGYPVTVFEAGPKAGGMLSMALPQFRLPQESVNQDVDYILKRGVEIKYNTPIDAKFRIRTLLNDEFKAVFVGCGAQKSQKLGIPGESDDIKGLYSGLQFLEDVKEGKDIEVGSTVAVIGGGNVALDAARTALRLGAQKVDILYRRSHEEMPVSEIEYDEAVAEGINMNFLVGPVRIDSEGGKVKGIQCNRMQLGEMDAVGRRRPVPMPGSEFFVDADSIIAAVGQSVDLSFLPTDSRLARTKWYDMLQVDENTLATNVPGIFAGGDFITGPDMVIHAIAAGKRGAMAIDKYLKGDSSRVVMGTGKTVSNVKPSTSDEERWKPRPRVKVKTLAITNVKGNFAETELPLTIEEAMQEAKRCLRCDLDAGE